MKILLFGASLGGQNFVKNHINDYEYLAIVDNDLNKHGLLINNIPIISPKNIEKYNYEKIIVSSMYVDSIKKQLLELEVPIEKIEFASKNSMKIEDLPFEDIETLQKVSHLIYKISNSLKEVPHFYTFGTLLGIVRDGNLIPWDDDIDIAIFADDIELVKMALLRNVAQFEQLFDIKIYERTYTTGKPASITVDCIKDGRRLFMVNFDCMYIDGHMVKQELNDTPLKYFEGYDEIPFKQNTIRVPKEYKDYLTYTYGDWQIVKRNTSFADNTISFREPLYSCTIQYLYESK